MGSALVEAHELWNSTLEFNFEELRFTILFSLEIPLSYRSQPALYHASTRFSCVEIIAIWHTWPVQVRINPQSKVSDLEI